MICAPTTPSEYSSGATRHQGGITKAGNGHAPSRPRRRRLGLPLPGQGPAYIQKRIQGLPKPVRDIGWRAQVRLCKRYRRLAARGKHHNIIVTAIARELLAFMWAIAKQVPIH